MDTLHIFYCFLTGQIGIFLVLRGDQKKGNVGTRMGTPTVILKHPNVGNVIRVRRIMSLDTEEKKTYHCSHIYRIHTECTLCVCVCVHIMSFGIEEKGRKQTYHCSHIYSVLYKCTVHVLIFTNPVDPPANKFRFEFFPNIMLARYFGFEIHLLSVMFQMNAQCRNVEM